MSDEIEVVATPEVVAPVETEEVVQLYSEADLAEKLSERDAEWQSKLSAKDAETSAIRSQFDAANVERSLIDAATKGDAFSAEQILNVLQSKTKIIDGQPTVEIEGYSMTPVEAVNWMRGQTDRFGNLFRNNIIGGLGGASVPLRGSTPTDVRSLSPRQYRALKLTNPERLGLKRGDS